MTSSPQAQGPSLTEQLAQAISAQIRQGTLGAGARLPSVRECAKQQGLSTSTVVAAYDRLLAQGLIEAQKQRGFFVRPRHGVHPPTPRKASHQTAPWSATSFMRSMVQPASQQPMPSLGTLPIEWLDGAMLNAAVRRVCQGEAGAALSLRYGAAAGEERLRQALSQQLKTFAVHAAPEQIITTLGATHALDVVSRSVLRAGDTVLVDEPGWSVEFARLHALGMCVLPVPRTEQGPDLEVMRQLITAQPVEQRPKLYVTVSVLHNPTSVSLSLPCAHRLLKMAQEFDFLILEDDTYAYLAPPHAPRLAALDGLERTIYVSGFSKILAPNWRVGFIAAPPRWVECFTDTKLLSTLSTPAITEQALAHCLELGGLRRHAERVSEKLGAARARSSKLAVQYDCRFVTPVQGLFGWVDVGVDTQVLAQKLAQEGWLIAAGALFYAQPHQAPKTLMRINFGTSQSPRFWQALDKARGLL